MFTSRPFVLTSTLAATAAVLATLSGPSAADSISRSESESAARSGDASRSVAVRQVHRKPLGAAPSVAVVDPTRGTIGSGARRARYDEEMFVHSARAAGAGRYVLHSGNELYVAQHGAPARFLADRASRGYQVGRSRHDRVAYYENAPTGPRLTVRRLRDGDVVGRLGVPSGVTPLAYRGGRVWFARGDNLVTWSPGTGRVQRRGTPAPEALDLTAGAGVRYASDGRTVVFPLRAGAGWRPWRTSGAGSALGWSPDGRRVALGSTGNSDGSLRRIEIRDARTGRLVRAFVTDAKFQFSLPALRWETNAALLVPFKNGPRGTHVVLRLRANGAVERASSFGPSSFEPGPSPVWTPSGPSSDVFH